LFPGFGIAIIGKFGIWHLASGIWHIGIIWHHLANGVAINFGNWQWQWHIWQWHYEHWQLAMAVASGSGRSINTATGIAIPNWHFGIGFGIGINIGKLSNFQPLFCSFTNKKIKPVCLEFSRV
jgi:hypothetical protein